MKTSLVKIRPYEIVQFLIKVKQKRLISFSFYIEI